MEGAQVKIPLMALYEALREKDKNKTLKGLVKKGLQEMAERHQVAETSVLPLLDDVVDKLLEESGKFNPRLPYPNPTADNVSVGVEMPIRGKVLLVEYNNQIKV